MFRAEINSIGKNHSDVSRVLIYVNFSLRFVHSINFPPEVVPFDQWIKLKPELKNMFSGWIKDAFRGGKKEMQESIQQQLHFILFTAPKWDRFVLA